MYDENSMKSHIFWIKFRRVFLLLILTIIGTALGVVISDYIVNILLFPSTLRIIIVVSSAVLFLSIALLLTANTGKEIEDGYWKIAVYKKLAIISKKLDNLEPNDSNKNTSKHDSKNSNVSSINKETQTSEENPISTVPEIISEISENNSNNNEVLDDLKEISNTLKENISAEHNEEKNNNTENQ